MKILTMKVLKLDKDTLEIIDKYNTYREAGESVGCSPSAIRQATVWVHRGANVKNYKWFALDEKTNLNHHDIRVNDDGSKLSIEDVKRILGK